MKAQPSWLVLFTLNIAASFLMGAGFNSKPNEVALNDWTYLEPGLELGSFLAPQKSSYGDSVVKVLRIDPRFFHFRLLNASASTEGKQQSARNWALNNNLVAAINASMYQKDNITSVSLMRTKQHINNQRISKDNTILAFDPKDPSVPAIQIIDRECQDFPSLYKHYTTLIQSIRMVSCKHKNVWAQQSRRWSIAAIGTDSGGNILFIHSRSPFSTHDLIENLIKMPIRIQRAMYAEGGPQAQLFINSKQDQFEFVGSYSFGSGSSDGSHIAWPVPNVIGIERATAFKDPTTWSATGKNLEDTSP